MAICGRDPGGPKGPPLRTGIRRAVTAGAHFGDAPPLDFQHLELQLTHLDALADVRHASEVRQQEATDRLEALALDLDAEPVAHFVDVHLAAEHERALTLVGHGL